MNYVYGIYVKNAPYPFYVGSGDKNRIKYVERNELVDIMILENHIDNVELKVLGEFESREDAKEVEELITLEYYEMGHCECNIKAGDKWIRKEYCKGKVAPGEANGMYGKKFEDYMTEEAIKERGRKLSEAHSGEGNGMHGMSGELSPRFKGYYVFEGIKYASSYIAAKETGVTKSCVYHWSHANKNGWSFEPKE